MSASRHRASCLLAPALLAGLLTLGLFLPAPAPAQSEPEQGPENEFAITTETGHILFVLQEQWEQWQGAFRLGDREGGDEALTFLLEALHALGMETIPEYARAAAALALKASLEGRFEQARWALKAAERLDPSVSEAAFARSALQRAEGERMPAMASRVEGYLRIWETPLRRILLVNDLLIWALAVVFLTCALFVVVQAAAKGGGIYSGLVRMLERWLPAYGAHAVVVVAILWPLILPSGVVCLLIYWSVMLWGFSTRSEKLVLLLAWIMLGVSPMLLETQRQRLSLAGSAASRALEGLDRHRLGGSLLSDLGVLASALPEDPAVDQLLGDVHRRFGQWEDARDRYLRVIDKEPKNVGALINVGVYYFLSGDLESAAEVFQRAAKLSPGSAVPYYNLSETYSASYAFERAEQSLVRARQVDARAVDRWIRREEGSRPVAVNGGLERSGEIRSRLHKLWKRTGLLLTWDEMLTRNRSLPVALALLGSAMALGWLRRRVPRLLVVRPAVEVGSSLDRWRRIFLPGIGSAESGHGLAAFAALLLPVFLICLPVTRQLGYPIPWALDPGTRPLGVAATVAFALWLAWHLWRQLRTWRQA